MRDCLLEQVGHKRVKSEKIADFVCGFDTVWLVCSTNLSPVQCFIKGLFHLFLALL